MAGFTPNGVPLVPYGTKDESDPEVDFDKLWKDGLDSGSTEVQDAYARYSGKH